MQQTGKDITTTLPDEIAANFALADLLEREQQLLVEADVDALPALTQDKAQLIARIAELANARYEALGAAGFSEDEHGMKAWTGTPAAPAAALASWNALLDVARKAKELNRLNGMLISRHMARNQATLNILHGHRQGTSLYGPDGQQASQSGKRGLVVG